jgi:hypothetical protein
MGIVITSDLANNCFEIDLGGLSADRKKATICTNDIRSVVADTDDATVEIVFTNGEIQKFPYTLVDEIDGDTAINSQDILYQKMKTIKFG